jgi:ABC-type polysaccharide/polyol phosphate transport system ATPase subunit
MQARLCLSLVAARPCDLFILDEVFDGADEFFREKISAQMLKTMDRSGAVIFVSHGADQIRRVCNRVIVLSQGAVAFDGGVEEGLEFYRKMNVSSSGVARAGE